MNHDFEIVDVQDADHSRKWACRHCHRVTTTYGSLLPDAESCPAFHAGEVPSGDSHPLGDIFAAALAQVATGKGEERHGRGVPFMEQPWVTLARQHGVGFLTGQAAKKLGEAQGFDDYARWEREMLGVIGYAAMAVKFRRGERGDA